MMLHVFPGKGQRDLAGPRDPDLDGLDGYPQCLPVSPGQERRTAALVCPHLEPVHHIRLPRQG